MSSGVASVAATSVLEVGHSVILSSNSIVEFFGPWRSYRSYCLWLQLGIWSYARVWEILITLASSDLQRSGNGKQPFGRGKLLNGVSLVKLAARVGQKILLQYLLVCVLCFYLYWEQFIFNRIVFLILLPLSSRCKWCIHDVVERALVFPVEVRVLSCQSSCHNRYYHTTTFKFGAALQTLKLGDKFPCSNYFCGDVL
jgi:hypothetical protein